MPAVIHFLKLALFCCLVIGMAGCSQQGQRTPPPTSNPKQGKENPLKIDKLKLTPVPAEPTGQSTATPLPTDQLNSTPLPTTPACNPTPPPPITRDPNKVCKPYTPITETNNCVCITDNFERLQKCTPETKKNLLMCQQENIDCGYVMYCHAKPVIYLYPRVPLLVDVNLFIPGIITVSIPEYPNQGWRNVLAMPDSTLFYQGQTYPYLYYETAVETVNAPKTGIVIKKGQLRPVLTMVLHQLGLNDRETTDFIEYWLPVLSQYGKPYMLFSVLDPEEKERIDKVVINPKPDTQIMINAYFKFLDKPVDIEPLQFPTTPPKRSGFTMVEWGGIIEKHN